MMEWRDIVRLYRYWRDSPPVHELVAMYLRFKPEKGRSATPDTRPVLELSADQIRAGFHSGTPEGVA